MPKTKERPNTIEARARKALQFVKRRAKDAKTWHDLHNAFYGVGGEFGRLFPAREERTAFTRTDEFDQIEEIIESLPGDPSTLKSLEAVSGKFVVRLPKSLHAALTAEAEAEGVSLNQLCIAKLAAQLRSVV